MGKKKLRTPLIKPRQQGGTFYTFASALEDVGLNINEMKNKVALSHYVLLNLPPFDGSRSYSELGEINKGDYVFAQDFQSYVLNMETLLRNQDTYNFADSLTVSERVFWKYLEKTGAVEFEDDLDKEGNPTGYFIDKNNCVQAFGAITSGAQRTDSYGLYNETFVQIPSSYGKMKVLFKTVDDRNFYVNKFYTDSSSNLIEYIDDNELADPSSNDYSLSTGLSGRAIYDSEENGVGCYEVSKDDHRVCIEFSLSELRKYYDDETLTYDDIAILHSVDSSNESIDSSLDSSSYYEFNSILVYYSIYDSTGKNILATNAYGILILDNATLEGDNTYKFPVLVKKKSTLDDIGNSYSFRLNIKTTSVYAGDVIVTDNSSPAYSMSEDFNDTIRNLADALDILKSNANLISVIVTDNNSVKRLVAQSLDKIEDIEHTIKSMKSGYLKNVNAANVYTSQLYVHTIDSSALFGDSSTGETVGSLSGDKFSYNNIEATESFSTPKATIENLNVKEISLDDDELIVKTTDGEKISYTRINDSGIYTTGQVYTVDETDESYSQEEVQNSIDPNTSRSLLENITVFDDGRIAIPSKDKIEESVQEYMTTGNAENDELNEEDLNDIDQKVTSLYDRLKYKPNEEGGDTYINLNILVSCLISQYSSLNSSIKELKESIDKISISDNSTVDNDNSLDDNSND